MLGLALAATVAACSGGKVVVVPFEPLASSPAEARQIEMRVRRAIAAMPGVCVEERQETVKRLEGYENHRLPSCTDEACLVSQAQALGAKWLVTGVVLGVGGRSNLSIAATGDERGRHGRVTVEVGGEDAPLSRAVHQLLRPPAVAVGPGANGRSRVPAALAAGGGAVSLAAAGILGALSQRTARDLSQGTTGCPGAGEAYRDCVDGRIREGRQQATAANILFGAGALLASGAAVMFVLEIP